MTYDTSINFSGDAQRAMQFAVNVLTYDGLKIISRTDDSLRFAGLIICSDDRRSPASIRDARITISSGTISAHARFGLMPLGCALTFAMLSILSIAFLVVMGVMWHRGADWAENFWRGRDSVAGLVVGLALLPLISLFLRRIARRRTAQTIDRLLHNMATAAGRSSTELNK